MTPFSTAPRQPPRQQLIRSALLAGLLGLPALTGCTTGRETQEQRHARYQDSRAQAYMKLCVEVVERLRVTPENGGALPRTLNGQPCNSPALGTLSVPEKYTPQVLSSLITLDNERLSAYVIQVESLSGKTLEYRDRGVQAAAAEQGNTFEAADQAATEDAKKQLDQ